MVKAVYPDEVQKSEEESKQAPDTALSINEHAVKDISQPYAEGPAEKDNDDFKAADSKEDQRKTAEDAVKGKVILTIIVWWVATVPVALLASFLVTKLLI